MQPSTRKPRSGDGPCNFSGQECLSLVLLAGGTNPGFDSHEVPAVRFPVIETDVDVKTPDGTCDAVFIHPTNGSHPGVLLWHDSPGLRPVIRDLGKRIAAEGYSALVPNLFYRAARAPVFDASFPSARQVVTQLRSQVKEPRIQGLIDRYSRSAPNLPPQTSGPKT